MAEQIVGAPRGNVLRIAVVSFGALVTALLFFADKTNLNNRKTSDISAPPAAQAPGARSLPPLAPDAQLDAWKQELAQAAPQRQAVLYDSLIARLVLRGRYDHAAAFAVQRLAADSSLNLLLQAGTLSQQAAQMDLIRRDSVLASAFSGDAIRLLSAVTARDARNEAALLALGLAYVNSGKPENSMQGILTIRKVLEINPDNAEAGYQLGVFSIQTGQYDKAAERLQRVLGRYPDRQDARYQLAVAQAGLGNAAQARSLLETVVAEASDPELKLAARELLTQLSTN
jgi:tetratricopeptide (TPR) repeat protein